MSGSVGLLVGLAPKDNDSVWHERKKKEKKNGAKRDHWVWLQILL